MSLLRKIERSAEQHQSGRSTERNTRILVVGQCNVLSGDWSIAEVLSKVSDFSVVASINTGADGIEEARKSLFDLAIVDLLLPDMSGFAVVAEILKFVPLDRIILTCTTNEIHLPQTPRIISPCWYLVKPVSETELLDTIRMVLETSLVRIRLKSQSPVVRSEAIPAAPGSYIDLKTRIQNRMLEQVDKSIVASSEGRAYLEDLFSVIIAEESIVLSRGERKSLFEAIISETLSQSATVYFSAYFPHTAQVNRRYGLYVYAHTIADAVVEEVHQDVEKFKDELGGTVTAPKTARSASKLVLGIPITIVPESDVDGLEFDPKSLTKTWRGDWTRFGFEFRPNNSLENETVFVRVSVQVEGIEIAHLKCAIDCVEAQLSSSLVRGDVEIKDSSALTNLEKQTTSMYQNIFVSYSHLDSEVAKAYKLAQTALGNEVFLDIDNLRAGEDWQASLAKAIDRADIFQLFWSRHSAASHYCRYEWEYALKFRSAKGKGAGFIRPVYWENPIPISPPEELKHLHFRYVPLKSDSD